MPQILALDLNDDAVCWAVRSRDGGVISATDAFTIGHTQSPGYRLLRVRNFLHELCREARIETIVYRESASEMTQFWLAGVFESAERASTPLQGVTAGAIKKAATGRGSASTEAVLAAVRDSGYAPANEGEAMALALLLLAESGVSLPSRMNGRRPRHRNEYDGVNEDELARVQQGWDKRLRDAGIEMPE